ncbi:MAG: isoaspartyl peptidase/L-asparaginase [Bacteroidota bacterium]
MKNVRLLFLLTLLISFSESCKMPAPGDSKEVAASATPTEAEPERAEYAIVIHGGAGTIKKENMTAEKEAGINAALNAALDVGEKILQDGGTALDAITQTIMILENSPYFNAGKGAVFTHEEKNELDASIMDGQTQNAGAIGGVTNIKNPILAARAVMENSVHVMLSGAGAEAFAKSQGIEQVDPSYFHTDSRWESLQRAKAKEMQTGYLSGNPDYKFGTVGCAALDKAGNLAAGTSTGGMTNKRWNRIGDAPIIGAGTYANNNTCATSSTGHGEYYIRYVVAHDISAMVEYKGTPFPEAAKYVIEDKLKRNGGSGGLIGVDKYGNVAMPFNTAGMYRGYAKPGERVVRIYEE